MKTTYISFLSLIITTGTVISLSCKRILEIPASKSQIESNTVFADSTLATSALLGAYYTMAQSTVSFKYLSLYSDEFSHTSGDPTLDEFYSGRVRADNYLNQSLWNSLFSVIYQANSIISESGNSALSPTLKQQLKAESLFLRAFANFYLLELYGHIPLILSPDVNENKIAQQTSEATVVQQIIQDLKEAKSVLPINYKGTGRVRANRWAAAALLARVYLFQNRFQDAADEATTVISSGLYSPLPPPENVFLSTSKEAILQWWTIGGILPDATSLIPPAGSTVPTYLLSTGLRQAFTTPDQRSSKWISTRTIITGTSSISYYYTAKYKNRTANSGSPEYPMALRLSEQYLIRAEALAQLQKTADATLDLNQTRTRAGLVTLPNTISQQQCLEAIEAERRLEFFGEYAHRFLDLKRYGELQSVIGTTKPAWKNTSSILPIPQNELTYNPKLKQNEGY